jgi:hypothetical protein
MFLMYTRAHVPPGVGALTHHPLQSTIPVPDAPMGTELVPIFRSVH